MVDGAEARGREGEEQPGPLADVRRYGLAADESGAHQVEGVACVEAGAGGADGCAAVAAADQEPFAGFVSGVVVVEDFAGCRVSGGGGAGEVDRVGAAAGSGELFYPAVEAGVLDEADQVLVNFGELTQARRTVEVGAPVSRGGLGGDGGGLPGWAAAAARMDVNGWVSSMAITPVRQGPGRWLADGAGAPAAAAAPPVSGAGPAVALPLADGAADTVHGHLVGPLEGG
ncbi:hypothetical protein TPA0910_48740 [Streptomyces hygroscopicus subsp. sporocinereus]|uniref:Uncharacterized protein n=1 Tax=Streptomyces hygroscopicus TaxID=1912 RepID=A0ABQ3U5A4_STRHY|nr:hypothetical protein TPA0910_48740 [Streptomyces hygroscopicus]